MPTDTDWLSTASDIAVAVAVKIGSVFSQSGDYLRF